MKKHVVKSHRIPGSTILCCAAVLIALGNAGCSGAAGTTTKTVSPATTPEPSSIIITVSPASTQTVPGGGIMFFATVTGTTNKAVNWSVQPSDGGTITNAGLYTAPRSLAHNPSTFTVVATSQADPSRSGVATVVVNAPIPSADILPHAANVLVNGTIGFEAVGFNTSTIGWTWHWAVKEGPDGGTIAATGSNPRQIAYTAPSTPGTFHIVLTGETDDKDAYGDPLIEVDGSVPVTVLPEAKPGTFINTGSMTTARIGYTATLLRDGRVLFAGGSTVEKALNTAEIYDPATGAFSATGNLTVARSSQAAVPLRDGRVLLAGGDVCLGGAGCPPSPVSSAEIYDPASGTFTATANLLAAHPCVKGFPLSNGKVLILGGSSNVVTAEIYDPEAQTFTAANTSNSHEFFQCPSATQLADGKVLLVDNPAYYGPPGSAQLEIFDPATGEYTLASPIFPSGATDIAGGSTLTLLNSGLVLLAGLEDSSCSSQGCDTGNFNPTTWLFDPSNNGIKPNGAMPVAKVLFTHTLLQDGTVLVTGGLGHGLETSAALYDPKSGTFSSTGNMSTGRYAHTATLLNDGRVLIVGGEIPGTGPSASAELYYPAQAAPATEQKERH